MKTLRTATFVTLMLLMGACAASLGPPARSMEAVVQPPGALGGATGMDVGQRAEAPAALPQAPNEFQSSSATDVERLVIQTASLSMVVEDPAAKLAAIRELAEGMGGFVVTSNIYRTSYGEGVTADQASITVRVPAERLQETLDQIEADAVEVRNENVSGQDVTSQYVDLQSRLRNLEAAEAQLVKIMDSAEKTEDVLAVYNQLVQVRGEIESVRGQMKYYEESASFSAITAELIPDVAAQPIKIGGWQPQGTVKAAVEALINALHSLIDVAIWVVICILPIALLIGIPLVLILRAVRRRRRRQAASGPPA
jgi:hypothetical protein